MQPDLEPDTLFRYILNLQLNLHVSASCLCVCVCRLISSWYFLLGRAAPHHYLQQQQPLCALIMHACHQLWPLAATATAAAAHASAFIFFLPNIYIYKLVAYWRAAAQTVAHNKEKNILGGGKALLLPLHKICYVAYATKGKAYNSSKLY